MRGPECVELRDLSPPGVRRKGPYCRKCWRALPTVGRTARVFLWKGAPHWGTGGWPLLTWTAAPAHVQRGWPSGGGVQREIYNYPALTAELQAAGHTFATRSDTEVLLHGWEEWGRALLPRLRGMFAFALWDRQTGTLFCARDAFGIKPLYYYQAADGTLLFASEIKAFLDHPAFEKQLNESQLGTVPEFSILPGEQTFFRGVKSCCLPTA